jgi:hypothetical protein
MSPSSDGTLDGRSYTSLPCARMHLHAGRRNSRSITRVKPSKIIRVSIRRVSIRSPFPLPNEAAGGNNRGSGQELKGGEEERGNKKKHTGFEPVLVESKSTVMATTLMLRNRHRFASFSRTSCAKRDRNLSNHGRTYPVSESVLFSGHWTADAVGLPPSQALAAPRARRRHHI